MSQPESMVTPASVYEKNVCISPKVISGLGATRKLTPEESGSLILLDRAAGIVLTLPPPVVGLIYEFLVTVTAGSGPYEVDTDAGTTFMLGLFNTLIQNSATSKGFGGDGSSHVKVAMNGTTTGGVLGTRFTVICVSATQWCVTGRMIGSSTIATPFA